MSADPFDVGALLRAAAATHAPPLTQADIARLTGMAEGNVSKAMRSPNTTARVARRILLACRASVVLRMPSRERKR